MFKIEFTTADLQKEWGFSLVYYCSSHHPQSHPVARLAAVYHHKVHQLNRHLSPTEKLMRCQSSPRIPQLRLTAQALLFGSRSPPSANKGVASTVGRMVVVVMANRVMQRTVVGRERIFMVMMKRIQTLSLTGAGRLYIVFERRTFSHDC